MGVECDIYTLEEMCDLMCDNALPKQKKSKKQWYVFTFGCGHKLEGYYVKIWGTFSSARRKMFQNYGKSWSFQYEWEEWLEWISKMPEGYVPERELEVIK